MIHLRPGGAEHLPDCEEVDRHDRAERCGEAEQSRVDRRGIMELLPPARLGFYPAASAAMNDAGLSSGDWGFGSIASSRDAVEEMRVCWATCASKLT